jgi:hypothetical protein
MAKCTATGKLSYRSKKLADEAASELAADVGRPMKSYKCQYREHWHVANAKSKRQRDREALRLIRETMEEVKAMQVDAGLEEQFGDGEAWFAFKARLQTIEGNLDVVGDHVSDIIWRQP